MQSIIKDFGDLPEYDRSLYKNTQCDRYVHITHVRNNPVNKRLYKDITKKVEYIQELKESILKEGLLTALSVFKDDGVTTYGHNRTEALKELNVDYVPVLDSPYNHSDFKDRPADMMSILANDNMRPKKTEWENYLELESWVEAFKEQYNFPEDFEVDSNRVKEFAAKVQFDVKRWNAMKILRFGNHEYKKRDDLVKEIKLGKKMIMTQLKVLKADSTADKQIKERPQHKELDGLLTTEHVEDLIKFTSKEMTDKFTNYRPEFMGSKIDIKFDTGTLSNHIHEYVVKILPTMLKKVSNIDAIAPTNNSHFDIISKSQDETSYLDWEIEVKTTMLKPGKSPHWTSGAEKIGYNLFVAFNQDFTRWAIGYVYIGTGVWRKQGAMSQRKLTLKQLNEQPNEVQWLIGGVDSYNDKFVLRLDKV
jgi:hypothetical protein